MALRITHSDEEQLVLTEGNGPLRALAFLLLALSLVWLISVPFSGCVEQCYLGPVLFTALTFLSSFMVADHVAEFSRERGELRLIDRRALSILTTTRTISFDEILVPDVVLARDRRAIRQDRLTLLLQGGERVPLHGMKGNSQANLKAAHDAIWSFLDLSPEEVPPDPFAERPGGIL